MMRIERNWRRKSEKKMVNNKIMLTLLTTATTTNDKQLQQTTSFGQENSSIFTDSREFLGSLHCTYRNSRIEYKGHQFMYDIFTSSMLVRTVSVRSSVAQRLLYFSIIQCSWPLPLIIISRINKHIRMMFDDK